MRAGKPAQAVHLLEEAAAADPHAIRPHALLAEAYRTSGERPAAARHFRIVGDLQTQADRHALAVEAYRQAARLVPHDAIGHLRLAEAYCRLDLYTGPVRTEPLSQGVPGRRVDDRYVLAGVADRPGWFRTCSAESAIYQIQAALDLGLDSPDTHLLHVRVLLGAGLHDRALTVCRSLGDRIPMDLSGEFWFAYSQASLAADDLETCLSCLRSAVDADPVRFNLVLPDAYLALADRYNRRGDLQGYLRCLEQAVMEAPRNAELYYRLGNAYREAGRHTDAARAWQITLELDPDHPQRSALLEALRHAAADDTPPH